MLNYSTTYDLLYYSTTLPCHSLYSILLGRTINIWNNAVKRKKEQSKGLGRSAPDKLNAFDSRRSRSYMFVRGRRRSGAGTSELGSAAARVVFVPGSSCCSSFRIVCSSFPCTAVGEFARKARASEDVLCFHSSAAPRLSHGGERRKIRDTRCPSFSRSMFLSLLALHGSLSVSS